MKGAAQAVRIIGGDWRGRKLHFPAIEGLRPTQDRFRETLFNWLMFQISGKHALDLFAGSGALGLEALSRGAAKATFIERDRAAAAAISTFLAQVESRGGQVLNTEASRYLAGTPAHRFDLVFLDPPFHKGLLFESCQRLEQGGFLNDNAWIYIESEPEIDAGMFPASWQPHREIRTASKWMQLRKRNGAGTA